jgi:hypothetical protein
VFSPPSLDQHCKWTLSGTNRLCVSYLARKKMKLYVGVSSFLFEHMKPCHPNYLLSCVEITGHLLCQTSRVHLWPKQQELDRANASSLQIGKALWKQPTMYLLWKRSNYHLSRKTLSLFPCSCNESFNISGAMEKYKRRCTGLSALAHVRMVTVIWFSQLLASKVVFGWMPHTQSP